VVRSPVFSSYQNNPLTRSRLRMRSSQRRNRWLHPRVQTRRSRHGHILRGTSYTHHRSLFSHHLSNQGLFGYVCDSPSILAPLEKYASELSASSPTTWDGSLDIRTLQTLYTNGTLTPTDVITEIYTRLHLPTSPPSTWITIFPKDSALARARKLEETFPDPKTRHPLFGIPFSVKDSIDVEGVETTAACPAYAYVAEKDAPAYAALIEAGCIPIGKVNLVRPIFLSPLYHPHIYIPAGPTSNRPRRHAIPLRPTLLRILTRLHLRRLFLRLLRLSRLQPSLVLTSHRHSWLWTCTRCVQ
jgi:hypothetical protein